MRAPRLHLLVLALALRAAAQGPADPEPLARLLREAAARSPEIAAARARLAAAERRVAAASPTVENAMGGAHLDDPPEAPQSLPMEELRLGHARESVRLREAAVREQVRLAWADAWLAHQRLRLNLRELQLVAELESATQAAVQTGAAAPSRVLALRAESLRSSAARMELLEQVSSAREELARLCGEVPAGAATNFPESLSFDLNLDRAGALELVRRESPELRLRRLEAKAAVLDAAEAAARREPRRLAAAEAARAAELELEAFTLALAADTARAVVGLNTYRHHLALYREHLLPQGARITEAARGEFAGGHADLRMALHESRMALDDRMEHLHHQAGTLRRCAALDRLAGGAWIPLPLTPP